MPSQRTIYFCLRLALFLGCAQTTLPAQDLSKVQAKSFFLVDAQTGEVLSQRNAHKPYPPASTVKLMTALLVWERTGLEGTIRVEEQDTRVEPSHIPLKVGETVAVRDLTHALLIGSDNDSAMTLARASGGSLSNFITLMNNRARTLGCQNTLFKNPHGLPSPGQYTTASDLMKIFQKVLSISELRNICMKKTSRIVTQVGAQNIKNHNKLLGIYPGMSAAKTGWTISSRHTYAASVIRDGRELRLIILNSPNKWTDARLLFDYGFRTPSRSVPLLDVIITEKKPLPTPSIPTASSILIEQAPVTMLRINPEPPRLHADSVQAKATALTLKTTTHQVKKGETLFSIGKTYGVNVPQILRYNALQNPHQIQPGLILFIPKNSTPSS